VLLIRVCLLDNAVVYLVRLCTRLVQLVLVSPTDDLAHILRLSLLIVLAPLQAALTLLVEEMVRLQGQWAFRSDGEPRFLC